MKHYLRIQKAVDFIEKNIECKFTLADVSKAAFSSLSYFHRIFYFMTGYTMKEYIRKRRLSNAALLLRCTELSVTEIALKACFESPESFTRAFKKQYDMSPRDFRRNKQEQVLFDQFNIENLLLQQPPADRDFQLALSHVIFKDVEVAGYKIQTTLEGGQQAVDICNFANMIMSSNKLATIFDLSRTPVFGVYTNMTDENEFDYTIACLSKHLVHRDDMLFYHHLPSSEYAKFTLDRHDRIKEAWHYIYGVWFPEIDQLRTKGLDFEIYKEDSVEIYIPMNR